MDRPNSAPGGLFLPSDRLIDRLAVTCDEAAQLTGLSAETIARAVRSGELRAAHVGRAVRVKIEEISKWLDSKSAPATASAEASHR